MLLLLALKAQFYRLCIIVFFKIFSSLEVQNILQLIIKEREFEQSLKSKHGDAR